MNSQIASCMEKQVIAVHLDDTAERVVKKLESNKLTFVPVIDSQGKCFGIISAADFVQLHNAGKNPKTTYAWEMCRHSFTEISPNVSIKDAGELMVKKKIHHLIVIENNKMKGIVSSIDLIRARLPD